MRKYSLLYCLGILTMSAQSQSLSMNQSSSKLFTFIQEPTPAALLVNQPKPWEKILDPLDPNCCGWLGHVISDAGKAVAKVIAAPTETALKTAGAVVGVNKPEDILKPYLDVAQSGAKLLETSKAVIPYLQAPTDMLYRKAGEYASKLGPGGEFVFNVATFSDRFYQQLLPTGTEDLILLLKGENPLTVIAAPLAAAIRQAENVHDKDKMHLPNDVIDGLSKYFPRDFLINNCFYAKGSVQITLPNFIGQGKKIFMGDDYAVVVNSTIVFNRTPPTFKDNPWWWGHEVNHIKQYADWKVDVFAYNYLKDLGKSVEGESDKKGDEVLKDFTASSGETVLIERKNYFKTPSTFNDLVIWQCIIKDDKLPASYVVTRKGKILAVNPLTGEYVHIGYAEPPIYIGSAFTFKTTKVTYVAMENGDLLQINTVLSPNGTKIKTLGQKIGEVKKIVPES